MLFRGDHEPLFTPVLFLFCFHFLQWQIKKELSSVGSRHTVMSLKMFRLNRSRNSLLRRESHPACMWQQRAPLVNCSSNLCSKHTHSGSSLTTELFSTKQWQQILELPPFTDSSLGLRSEATAPSCGVDFKSNRKTIGYPHSRHANIMLKAHLGWQVVIVA